VSRDDEPTGMMLLPPTGMVVTPPGDLPFEAQLVREAALACHMAASHNCTIEITVGGRWGKRPVSVTVTPHGSTVEAGDPR
jgi:hypothetical protein